MQQLVGHKFQVGDGEYRVVDVRRLSGETMVYAEEVNQAGSDDRRPRRAAFHYSDIANFLFPEASNKIA